jgi:electron transport complex protein RnfG
MAGFKPDGTIFNIAVLEHKETPGLGTKMSEPSFKDQFMEKNPSDFLLIVKNDGGPVDAITAATISSRAFCDAVQRAYGTLFSGGTYDGTSGPSDTESQ